MRANQLARALIFVSLFLVAFYPSPCPASGDEILRRLERLEKEVEQLKDENRRLRQAQEDKSEEKNETERLTKTMEEEGWRMNPPEDEFGTVEGKYDMWIYGRVKVDMNYDTSEFRRGNDWLGMVGAGEADNDSTNFNPRDSRIGFKIARRDGEWMSQACIETDFYGDNNGSNLIPRMRLGYLDLSNHDRKASLLIGQDWTPVARLNPPTIDFGIMAAAGNLWWRVPQVTFRKQLGRLELSASAMKHRRQSTAEEDRMPWMLGRIALTNDFMGNGGLFALGGGIRRESLARNTYDIDNDVTRWLLALEMKLNLGDFTLASESWIGDGLGSTWLRSGMDVNTNDNPAYAGTPPSLIRAMGGFASLTYRLNSNQSFSAGYGIDDPRDSDMEGMTWSNPDRQFTKNEMIFLNSWYSITKAIKLGGELMYIVTERLNDSNDGMRYTFSAKYTF